ncbi:hypothetical protein J41TS12_50550 [Paenibacillus antibioticophila]|uniref:Uncharacterized protein n=1 Tax=Paenibacillus antibioticophila TaxID=1274374 RepID=A0A920CK66_9BACL|nr:hypothetical protein [Paenibacillus antibioticophila]GIO40194.1 hypothetical protein J41TS12_50550 [Paenibacillus antibioticophila]
MSKYHFRKLQNEIRKDRQHRIKQLTHQLRYGNLSNEGRKGVIAQLDVIGGGV